eukprot:41525-Karenia_brevis.AAC.1
MAQIRKAGVDKILRLGSKSQTPESTDCGPLGLQQPKLRSTKCVPMRFASAKPGFSKCGAQGLKLANLRSIKCETPDFQSTR